MSSSSKISLLSSNTNGSTGKTAQTPSVVAKNNTKKKLELFGDFKCDLFPLFLLFSFSHVL